MSKKKAKAQRRQERNARAKVKANMKNVHRKGDNFNTSKNPLAPSGLRNNGNTCYYNSTIQCLSQVYTLYRLLDERGQSGYLWKATVIIWNEKKKVFTVEQLKLSLHGDRTTADLFLNLVKDILSKNSTTPSNLLDEIRSKNSQFRGFSQQDAHELCLSLISQMRDDEISLQRRALYNHLKISLKNQSEEDKKKAQKYRHVFNHTPLDAVFGGQLVSWVKCSDCGNVSVNFERFYDLSLSLPSDTPASYPNRRRKGSIKEQYDNHDNGDDDDDDDDDNEHENSSKNSPENEYGKLSVADRKKKRAQKKALRRMDKEKQKLSKANNNLNGVKDDGKFNGKKGSHESCDSSSDGDDNPKGKIAKELKVTKEPKDALELDIDVMKDRNSHHNHKIPNDMNLNELLQELDLETTAKKNRKEFNLSVLHVIKNHDSNFDNKMLGDLLKNFITVEVLQGDNKYICEYCSKRCATKTYSSKALKGQLIALPPQTLIIQLKRFETTGSSRVRGTRKCNTSVEFPLRLNLSPFTSSIYEALSFYYEPFLQIWKSKQILDYNLFGVVVHLGDLQFGHYVAYVKVRKEQMLVDNKEQEKFVHLRQFFPNFDHVFELWCMARKAKKCFNESAHSNNLYHSNNSSPYQHNGPSGQNSSYQLYERRSSSPEGEGYKNCDHPKSTDSEQDSNYNNKSSSSSSSSDSEDSGNDDTCDSLWFYCSDSDVRTCTEEDVLRNTTGQYFMLYERCS